MTTIIEPQNVRLANKPILRRLNELAAAANYNRQIVPEAIDSLPDTVMIALQPLIIHEHAAGKPVDPHLRCRVLAFDISPELPQEEQAQDLFAGVFLDIAFDAFELLPTPKRPAAKQSTNA